MILVASSGCGYPCKTTVHLLINCPDTTAFHLIHGLSFDTLVNETPDKNIAHFDAFIWHVLGCTYWQSSSSFWNLVSMILNANAKVHLIQQINHLTTNNTNDAS
jgi:hypothetical protein